MSFNKRMIELLHEHHASEGLKAALLMLYNEHVADVRVNISLNELAMHIEEMDQYEKYMEQKAYAQILQGIEPFITRTKDQILDMKRTKYSIKVLRETADDQPHTNPKADFGQQSSITATQVGHAELVSGQCQDPGPGDYRLGN